MVKEETAYKNEPAEANILKDVIVEIPQTDVITPKFVSKTLYRDYAKMIVPFTLFGIFSFTPILCCIFFYNDTFRWYYTILPVLLFLGGLAVFYYLILSFIKTRKRTKRVLNGEFIIKKSSIRDVYFMRDVENESDHYLMQIDNASQNWIRVPSSVFYNIKLDVPCYTLYFSENEKNKLFLIYIGDCTFDTSVI